MPENEEQWEAARLIPVTGIKRAAEKEGRATSALLAVLGAVREFGREILRPLGAPAGTVTTYTEVPFSLGEQSVRVDGLVRVTRAKADWYLLLEVKTGTAQHDREQVERYLDVAKQQGFAGGLLTISNDIAPLGEHPVTVDRRKYRNVPLHHMSWFRILSTAIRVKEHRGVRDSDQAWILRELIRYLQHENSGATAFADMGPGWTTIREAARAGTLRPGDAGAVEVCQRWDQLIQYAALTLGASLGEDVTPHVTRAHREEPELRIRSLVEELSKSGRLSAALRIPSVIAPLHVEADLRTKEGEVSIVVQAPEHARSITRVKWLVDQLRDAPADCRVDARFRRRPTTSEKLGSLRGNPRLLIDQVSTPPTAFVLTLARPVGGDRGSGRNSFINGLTAIIEEFHATIAAGLHAPTRPKVKAPPPQAGTDLTPEAASPAALGDDAAAG